jgi:predicted DNA-binding protein (UPF0251 family)
LARPKKYRMVEYVLKSSEFSPKDPKGEVEISMDELEAMRLADIEKMYQADAAQLMGISRQTFGRIVDSAHAKVADAILNSKRIKTGNMGRCRVVKLMKCDNCNRTFREPVDYTAHECPYCHNEHVHEIQ